MQPCEDAYSTNFSTLPDMLNYHVKQSRQSHWVRSPVNSLRILPLTPSTSTAVGANPEVSLEAIADTMENLGLAAEADGNVWPVRTTAYKSLLDRAKINGSALPKLDREDLANILNTCLALHSAEALVLIRDEKVSAVHAGDEQDYSILPVDALMNALCTKLDERFPCNEFAGGYTDHTVATAMWSFPDQRKALLETYDKALAAHGQKHLVSKLIPGIRFSTSDVGMAAASVSALLLSGQYPIRIGSVVAVEHRRQSKVSDFDASLDMLFAQFADTLKKLERLLDITLIYPVNAMTSICKRLSMPKKAALEAIDMFHMAIGEAPATAHDVYFAMQEILFILKSEGTPQSKLLSVEEAMARALTLRWEEHDLARGVSY